ncbi:rapid alkalinization factor precursor [Populus alba x Populus x berolinensis]|nr:rapid alkalinization factor precursor [Populus alba x Populus x berolinensis]
MAKWSSCFLISATILILIALGLSFTIQGSGDHHLGWIPITTTTRSSICNKESIIECMAKDENELEMDTKINKYILAANKQLES